VARRAQGAHRGEGRQVAEVVAGKQDRAGSAFGGEGGERGSLVPARRAQLDDH